MGQTDTGQTARRKDGKGEWLMNTQGLTSAQAAARLSQVGENRLAAKKQASVAAMFFSQFKEVMILVLAAAPLISVLMGQGAEAVTINACRATCFFWRRATKLPQMQGCKARRPCSATRPC